jgi:WD40 repeat protein
MKKTIKCKVYYLTLLFVSLFIFACKKDNGQTLIDLSGLSIVNAVPSVANYDVYVDDTKVSPTDFTFGNKIDYLNAYSGRRKITVTNKSSNVALKTEYFILEPQYGYTLFMYDKIEDLKFMMLPDNLTKPPKDMASVRFANLSPDSENLTLSINGNPAIITNIAFKDHSNAIFVSKGDNVRFEIRGHQTGELLLTLNNINLEEGKIYTVFVNGLKNTNTSTVRGVSIYTHK